MVPGLDQEVGCDGDCVGAGVGSGRRVEAAWLQAVDDGVVPRLLAAAGEVVRVRGVQEFSLDVAMAWVDEACGGFFEKEQAGALKATDVYLFRVAAMLDDFSAHGAVLRRYSRTLGKLSAEQADVLARFRAWLRVEGCAASTVRAYGTVVGEFLAFTGRRGGLAGLDGEVVGAFVRRWPAIRQRRWSTSCARYGRSCGSLLRAG